MVALVCAIWIFLDLGDCLVGHVQRAMHTATAQSHGKPKLSNPRHPERSLLHQTVAEHFGTWLELASAG